MSTIVDWHRHNSHPRRGVVACSSGFTLIELLVVIGIIALLLGILIPVVSKARQSANTTYCISNQKSLIQACLMFAHDHNNAVPYSGYNDPAVQNWCYDFSKGMQGTQVEVEAGQIWPYLKNYKAYHCAQNTGPWAIGRVDNLTGYVMNGAMSAFGNPNSGAGLDINQFQSNAVVFWELPSVSNTNGANDATNGPQEGVVSRHNKGTTLSHLDGHVDVITAQQFNDLCQYGPNQLWCDPTRPDGGYGRYTVSNPIPIYAN